MKYWRGYLVAAILAALSYALKAFAQSHTVLVDMIYPYLTRTMQGMLAQWSSTVPFCLWQVLLLAAVVIVLATIVLMILFRWNPIQWLGWVAAAVSFGFLFQTCIWGLNYYAGPLATDVRLEPTEYTLTELATATRYYRDRANTLSILVDRNPDGSVDFGTFAEMADQAGDGFHDLTYNQGYAVFAGSTIPVKELGWSDYYSSIGICGMTVAITGEAAVNPQIPTVSLPFTMCHEMSHRMSIAVERDANFAAFLATISNPALSYQYSGYYMAYRYCYIALSRYDPQEASKIMLECSDLLKADFASYDKFFQEHKDEKATEVADKANDTYLKSSGDTKGIASYGDVCDLLVNWHLHVISLPPEPEEEDKFNPLDKSQVDLSGIINAELNRDPAPTEAEETEESDED